MAKNRGSLFREMEATTSVPLLATGSKELLPYIPSDFKEIMDEVRLQRDSLVSYHDKRTKEEKKEKELQTMEDSLSSSGYKLDVSQTNLAMSSTFSPRRLQRLSVKGGKKTSISLQTSRAKSLRRTRSAQIRSQKALEIISKPPLELKRRLSYPLGHDERDIVSTHQPSLTDYHKSRWLSLPSLGPQHFSALMRSQHADPDKTDHRDWAFGLWWESWFPEVLAEYKEEISKYTTPKSCVLHHGTRHRVLSNIGTKEGKTMKTHRVTESTEQVAKGTKVNIISGLELADIEPLDTTNTSLIQALQSEVESLTEMISSCKDRGMQAVQYCRRGAILRKLGQFQRSYKDLDKAISLHPKLSDAYWHRHLLLLLKGDDQRALDDLTTLLRLSKQNIRAFHSKAIILAKMGKLASALYNLTQAINLSPKNPDLYFLRAELYEKRGEMEYALSDYSRVAELDPTCTEPLKRQAMHKYNKNMWAASTQHFSALLLRDPNNTIARIHRAKAQYNLGLYAEALQDVSASIHLEPNNPSAFFLRACLLRITDPEQALKDFSMSLLLDNSVANISAYVHRGVLYTQLKWYNDALADFESAMKLKHSLPSPHVLAGLIHMNERNDIPKAVQCFTTAINVDQTCIRAYLCRAEAYKIDKQYQLAAMDYTRVLHFEPSKPAYHLYRGEVYLLLKDYKLASLHVKIASKLTTGFNQAKTQKALVEAFLGNHQQAITLLRTLPKDQETYSLLGKVQLKAKMFPGAAESFRQSISLMDAESSQVKSEAHFLCGQSLREGGSLKKSIDQFNKVINLTPTHVKAYYERGVARLKAGQEKKGIRDLNKALALDSKFFQSYLTRASYFGNIGHHSKAILNCNEAIEIKPNCVRAYLTRGSLKYLTKSYSGAIEDLTMAIKLDPVNSGPAHFNRALCYQAIGKPKKALADYSAVMLISKEPGVKVLVNRGLLYLQNKDYGNALLDLADAGKRVPDDPAIFQVLGYCYHQLGILNSSIEAYSVAICLDPSFLEAIVGRGNAFMDYLKEETNNLSKSDYHHALDLDPSHLPARVNLAFVLQAEGKFQEAWQELTSALKMNKNYVPALEARAIVCLQMGNLYESFMDLTTAIDVKQTATLLTNRGVVNQFMGNIVSAMNDYQHALKIDHTHVLAHFNIGNVLFHQRLFDQAATSYTKALSHSTKEDDSILVNRAITYSIMKKADLAMRDFEQAIEVNPFSAMTYFNRGNLRKSLGNYEEAEQDYKKGLELQPDDWLALQCHGEVLGRLGRRESALEAFRQAIDHQSRTAASNRPV